MHCHYFVYLKKVYSFSLANNSGNMGIRVELRNKLMIIEARYMACFSSHNVMSKAGCGLANIIYITCGNKMPENQGSRNIQAPGMERGVGMRDKGFKLPAGIETGTM